MLNGTLIGRLGRDPVVRDAGNSQVMEAAVAYDTGWGERKATTWVKVEVWGKRGMAFAEHHAKGDTCVFHGLVKLEKWTNRDGDDRQTLVMEARDWEFAGRRNDRQQPAAGGYSRGGYDNNGVNASGSADDGPF